MSGPVRSTRCRTSANRSYRWTAVVTIVAMLSFAGYVLAGTGANQGTKVVPATKSVKDQKSLAVTQLGDAPVAATTTSAVKHSGIAPMAAPSNDDCTGAVVISPGSLPYVSPTVDITDATPQEVDEGLHTCASGGADRTVWYSFTPTITGAYVVSTCNVTATGSTVYDTVLSIFSSSGGACPESGAALACNDSAACAGAIAGAPYVDQGTASAVLTAGNTYFFVVGHWAPDTGGVSAGYENVAISVVLSPAPSNDACGVGGASATPLTLGQVTHGTTESATNDYRSAAGCFTGVGQIASSSNGLDVVFSFTPPANGKYNFRYVQDDTAAALRSQSPVLYLTDNCPAPNPGAAVGGCIAAANRMNDQTTGNGNRSEEINCVSLTAGTPYYLFFDDRFTGNLGGPLDVEVTSCLPEVEPNDDIATATPYPGCAAIGSITTAADVDFWSVGTPPAGSKLFAGVQGAAANSSDFAMQITNTTDTLGFDDNDGTSWIGSNAPVIGGVFADGNPLYVRISAPAASEPYHLYWAVETGTAQNEVDTPSNGTLGGNSNLVTGGGFVKGIMATATDLDCFRFVASKGDNLGVFSDANPGRLGGTITNNWGRFFILNPGNGPVSNPFIGQVLRNNLTPSPGVLNGTSPSVTSEFYDARARYTGTYWVCYTPVNETGSATPDPPASAYPLPYQGAITSNCAPLPAPSSRITDLSVTKSGPAGPVNTGDVVEYTITVTNNSNDIAQEVDLIDQLPSNLNYLSLSVLDSDGFGLSNFNVKDLPSPGTADAPIDIVNYSMAPGATTTYFLLAQVANCSGAGATIENTATISSASSDPDSSNNSSTWSFSTSENGLCQDLLCDASGCITNACTVNDHCDAGQCVSDPKNCDDNSLCTDDSCDPSATGEPCINDSSQLGDLCFDGNDCTFDTCDPLTFCAFPPRPAGIACDDFLGCTNGDQCDGAGGCVGLSVCDDGLPCTDDFADEGNACACDNPLSFPGTVCDDGNACTTGTTCDGSGGSASACNGGAAVDCNDNNPCTDDSCDSVLGCVHTNNSSACDDGNACTTGDTCGGGTCNGGGAVDCNDNNPCTDDTCDSGTGCGHSNNSNACDDGNACTIGDTCGGGSCGAGAPVTCSASDQCHVAGTCNPGTGLCSDPAAADGTVCDDGNAATHGDACTAGVCTGSTCDSANDPRTKNYYKKLCNNRNAGEQISDADAVCVGENTSTFAGITTAAQVCAVITSNQPSKCDKAEGDLMALALNVCHQRVCPDDSLTSQCGSSTSVGQSYGLVDAAVSSPSRTNATCNTASCFATEINSGTALSTFTPSSAPVVGDKLRVLGKQLPGTIEQK